MSIVHGGVWEASFKWFLPDYPQVLDKLFAK